MAHLIMYSKVYADSCCVIETSHSNLNQHWMSHKHAQQLYILYPMQRNHWFVNSDVPFQSVTNGLLHGQFAMQAYALHQVDVTSELLHSWWFAHVQSNNKTINVWLCVYRKNKMSPNLTQYTPQFILEFILAVLFQKIYVLFQHIYLQAHVNK